jgi:crotonobetainyl-CoA:carnitine CoA-transferase CaiB-like acyl-CoA transferase
MGNDEAVTPVFPNSDYCTGVCGSTGVLDALVRRGENGGSYGIDVSKFLCIWHHLKVCSADQALSLHVGVLELLFTVAS